MGLLLSCCRRRKDPSDDDRKPLLPKHRANAVAEGLLPSKARLNHVADVIAALKAGKLPSQEQLAHVLRVVIHATSLDASASKRSLSEPGQRLVNDLHTFLQKSLQFGLEKNGGS